MVRPFTNNKHGVVVAVVILLGLSACTSGEAYEYGAEPTLGTPVTVYRDNPVVTSDLDVLGTVQTTLPPTAEDETAVEPLDGESDLGLRTIIWLGIVALAVMSFAITLAARSNDVRAQRVKH